MHSNSSFSIEHLLTIISFDSSSSIEQIYDSFSSTRNSFNLLSSVEKRALSESVSYQSFLFLQGKCVSWENQLSSYTSQAILLGKNNCP